MNETLARAKTKLFERRARRVPPGTDTKIITSWNSLAIAAFAEASRVLDNPAYRTVAERAARFLLEQMRGPDGRLLRTWKANPGVAKLNAYLEDYAYLIHALTLLYEATFDLSWLTAARELAETMLDEFSDPKGGFYDTGRTHEALVLRPKDVVDNAMPSGNAMATLALLRLGVFLGEPRYHETAARALRLVGAGMGEHPLGFGQWLIALDGWLTPTTEFALLGDASGVQPFLREIFSRFLPTKVVVHAASAEDAAQHAALVPLLHGREPLGGAPTAYLCYNLACQRPTTDPAALAAQIGE